MPNDLRELLERARRELLDLSTRNRLLSVPVNSKSARVIHIQDELATEVFRLLVEDRKTFSFQPSRKVSPPVSPEPPTTSSDFESDAETSTDDIGVPPPDDTEDETTGLAKRHVDSRLQTSLTPEGLQRRLLDLYRDAQTTIEETGVNVLYLALGQLKWFEAEQADTPRFAPLVLVPVDLLRKSAADRFYLKAREEDVEANLSLEAKLQSEFGIKLPAFPDAETMDLAVYFNAVQEAVSGESNWQVLPNAISLGFFSFAKFLMYRDLDPDKWSGERPLLENSFVSALLGDGFSISEPAIPEETQLDELIPVERLDHVVDADGSQTLAIEMARQGRSMVIQGPPGTGKSQSITNIIATAVLEGKRVLFVAEKLAALEVVKRRLEREDLGDVCLELHSNKASKRMVLEEIGRTWRLGKPRSSGRESLMDELQDRRATLNGHVEALHKTHEVTGLTPFRVIGELVSLGEQGMGAAQIDLVGAESWNASDRAKREQLIDDLAERIRQIGVPVQHPWRGVQRETILAIDLPPLLSKIHVAGEQLTKCVSTGNELAALVRADAPANLATAKWLILIAEHVAQAPPVDRQALCAGVWNAGLEGLRELLDAGERFDQANQSVGQQVIEAVWEKDFQTTRLAFAAHGQSWLRIFNGDYRRAMAEVRGGLKAPLPTGFEARLAFIDELVAGQQALRVVRGGKDLGTSAFGAAWRGERSDWANLRQILAWVEAQQKAGLGEDFRRKYSAIENPVAIKDLGIRLAKEIGDASRNIDQLFLELQLDVPAAFGVATLDEVIFSDLATRLSDWSKHTESLSRWSNFFLRSRQGHELGLGPLVDALYSGMVTPAEARVAFRRACFSRILRELTREQPELARFDGESHDKLVAEFRKLDQQRLMLAKYRVLAAHHERMPSISAGVGAVGIVNSELERKRGHRPVRQLLRDAGSVMQAIKPVFMMSPLSVAQFLAPGAVEFDLLIIDEASQVQPVDALGAIVRCQQMIVVGDSKQLPPTRFFSRMTGDSASEESDEADVAQVQDIESILGLCLARGLPQSMLRWHYRSRHHSLIAVSNQEFYENRLFIVPSPYATSAELGLRFRHVSEGVFDTGVSGTNRIEAKAVCRAVIEHARKTPGLSLGVAAFSVRQQQAILDELEFLRRENPDTEAFFNGHPTEPFFVKNLENVQGDERDVIFISIGYGRDLNGNLAMRFGPLGNDGGERRLNVLISRARKRCEVFSSITADDIDLERVQGRGVRSLKAFLQFAKTGDLAVAQRSGREEDSPFEESVHASLKAAGYEIHPQVGIAGFFIDLAVVDSERPGRYVLGIECDGAAYHSARSARDRDRLRQAVLEDHGWNIHRIWSTDWFQRPQEQLQRAISAIEQARYAGGEAAEEETTTLACATEIVRDEDEEAETSLNSTLAQPYVQAQFAPPTKSEPHQLSVTELADVLYRIVQAEGPIHEDELAVRVKDIWGFQRIGPRLQDAVAKGVRALLVSKQCLREEDCLLIPDAPVPIRRRDDVQSASLRKPDLLPPVEIRAAMLALIDEAHGVGRKELPTAVARLFGFKTTTVAFRETVQRQIQKLLETGQLTEANDLLLRSSSGESTS